MTTLLSTSTLSSTTKLSLKLVNNDNPAPKSHLATDKYKHTQKVSFVSLAVKKQQSIETIQKVDGKITRRRKGGGSGTPFLSEGRDEDESYGPVCPGCGIFMQDNNPDLPGYYKQRKLTVSELPDVEEFDEEEEEEDIEGSYEESDGEESELEMGDDEFDWDSDDLESKLLGEEEENDLDLDGFAPAGVGYGNIKEETIERMKRKKVPKAEKKRMAREAQKEKDEVTVCARCHSLRNYGQVKNQAAENLMPDFDFDRLIATRLIKPATSANPVVVMVVDCVDFDGSFPKRAAKSLFQALRGTENDPKFRKKMPRLVLVATKVDLLPSQVSPSRLDRWVRHRAKAGGGPKLSGVYLVSAHKDVGVRNLLSFLKELAGPRGNVWVVGAQNAGKSTLINALAKKEGAKVTKLTEAPVPGTTLGILRVGGILSAKAKLFDTPGLLHPYLVSMRLNRDEQKMVEIRKELRPRTYRIKARQTIHIGGLVRVDLIQASVETIYFTIWASPNISLHMGKTENAEETWRKHVGVRLQPPIGIDRAADIGKWEEREVKVSGASWDVNSIDIAIAGLGWFSLGLKGEATLALWTYDGIEITLREPLVLDRAPSLERPGFWLPKAISEALGAQSKLEAQRKKLEMENADSLSEAVN
ncbi:GTP-binding protein BRASSINAZOLE INSENSITIVE PALE GREEN 2, chloroplastic [Rosa sericea]